MASSVPPTLSPVMTGTGSPAGSAFTTTTGTGDRSSHCQLACDTWLDAMIMPVDAAVDHQVEVVHRPVLVVGGAPEQDGIAERAGGDVGRLDELGEERVLDVGDDQPQRPRPAHPQRSRHAGRAVGELVDRGHDRRRGLGLRVADPREHAAHGRGRDARPHGDVADRDRDPRRTVMRGSFASRIGRSPAPDGGPANSGNRFLRLCRAIMAASRCDHGRARASAEMRCEQ